MLCSTIKSTKALFTFLSTFYDTDLMIYCFPTLACVFSEFLFFNLNINYIHIEQNLLFIYLYWSVKVPGVTNDEIVIYI